MVKIIKTRNRRKYTLAELELIQEYLLPFENGCDKAIEQARFAVKVAPCNMTEGQLRYWQAARKFLNWVNSTIQSRQEKLLNNE